MVYVKSKEARKQLGVSDVTLRHWAETGQIDYVRVGSRGNRLYDIESFIHKGKEEQTKRKKYIYCRVSSSSQKEDLERQIEYLKSKYPENEVVKDIASGINFKRKGLNKILANTMQGLVEEVVVAHKDRLCRIAWDHFEWLFKQNGVTLVVEDQQNYTTERELADDLFSIIHVFSARHYGARRGYTLKGTEEDTSHDVEKTGGSKAYEVKEERSKKGEESD